MCLRLICFFSFLVLTRVSGQPCTPDASILNGDDVFFPSYWTPENPAFDLAISCIDLPYAQTLTIHPPSEIVVPGLGTLLLNGITIATTGAIINLPEGMSYTCNPPNCVFNSLELGCIQLEGTPSSLNEAPDTVALSILGILDIGFPVVVTLPNDIEPGALYPLIIMSHEACVSAVDEPKNNLQELQVFPNPFQGETTISLFAPEAGTYTLRVFDTNGRARFSNNVLLSEGRNIVTLSAEKLQAGIYVLELRKGRLSTTTRITIIP